MRRYILIGTVTCLTLVFGVGGWAATAQLASAVIANGTVVVASNVKEVQHPDGGIVGEITVDDGDRVEKGDLLIRLDDTVTAATRAQLDGQIVSLEARLARLRAERTDAETITVPPDLTQRMDEPRVKQAIESEREVFDARKETMAGQVERLNERVDQLEEQISGLEAQKTAKEEELTLINDELEILTDLYDRGRTTRDRVVNMKRTRTRLKGEAGKLASEIAMAKGRINETRLEILSITTDRREKTFSQITEIEPKLANLKERRTAASFKLERMDIRSPATGSVFELTAHTEGGVIQPAQQIMKIVPKTEALVIEARVVPTDVDEVAIGQEATVVLSAFDYKTTPQLKGEVSFVSAEASQDENTGQTYYSVKVSLSDEQMDRLPDDIIVLPGMPAELYISTGGQTVVAYLMRPLTDQIRKAWRET